METNTAHLKPAKEKEDEPLSRTTCSLYIEASMTRDDVAKVHSFGECWIRDYDRNLRQYWMKALWLYAWEKKVVFDPTLTAPQMGISPENNWRSGIGTVETWEHGTWDPELYPILEESPFQLWRCPQ